MVRRFLNRLVHLIRGDWILYRRTEPDRVSVVLVAERGVLLALVVMAGLRLFLPSRGLTVMLVALAAAVGLSFGWAVWGVNQVRFSRQVLHEWVQVGDRLEEVLTLHNDSALPVLAAEIEDRSNLPGYDISTVRAAGIGEHHSWRQTGISHRRGLFRLGPTVVRFSDPLGIFTVVSEHIGTREVLVFPPVLHDLAASTLSGGGQGMATSRQRSLAETAAIGGVRDYHPGDPIRRIHWPLSARHQTFLVKEFDREMGANVWLALDLNRAVHEGEGDESTLEYGIVWAASWAWHLLRAGKGVGLYTYGPERTIVLPRVGAKQLWHILRALAPVDARTEIPLSVLLEELRPHLTRGDALVVITPSLSPDWPWELVRPGLRTAAKVVELLDASSFRVGPPSPDADSASPSGESVAGMRALLAQMGVPARLVQRRESLLARPAAPGGGDWDFVITPLGKAVARSRPARVKS